ncbi:flavin reductase family protein [Roseobacter sp. HKCCA0434]|uniref:flavin reductase family protein n=1 Tax=Roseobacter sp. HKCCA0434 TaxID=3079297 RepID=UPI002905DB48|nr:flavin reductase family protein [Roseobacter sp. HKCCA0434]
MTEFSPRDLRDACGAFATGVTVVTCRTDAGPVGITANSFSSLSLDPPLVMWAPARRSARFEAFTTAEAFTIHILNAEQQGLAAGFAGSGEEPFALHDWADGPDGVPEFGGSAAILRCRLHAVHPGGDHAIVVGEVTGLEHDANAHPLVFHAGLYPKLA